MSDLYTSNDIMTEFIDPTSFVPNSRCAFELAGDKLAYLSNMRLVDLGCISDGVHTTAEVLELLL